MLRRILVILAAILFIYSISVACVSSGPGGGSTKPGAKTGSTVEPGLNESSISRDTNPDVTDEQLNALVDGNNTFNFDLYKNLKTDPKNLFFSSFSISQALAMTWAGAKGNTESQMAQTLHFNPDQATTHKSFNKLDMVIAGSTPVESSEIGFQLNIANSIWAQKGHPWLPKFLDTLKANYGAGIYDADFETNAEDARTEINKWVEKHTNNKIKDLIQEGVLGDYTRMVLVNAIYFLGKWETPFKKESTNDGSFTLLDGSTKTVPLMFQSESHKFMAGDGYKAVELGYKGTDIAMLIILPDLDKFTSFEDTLDSNLVKEITGKLENKTVDLTLPKVKMEAQFELANMLKKMGMPDAFSESADFSGMDGVKDLFISKVIHKAFVAIDEDGTEAAAATAVEMSLTMAPMESETVEFKADHPFIFMIRDTKNGSILFTGRVLGSEF